MYKLSELFKKCAWEVPYTNVNDWVSYAFVEEGNTLFIFFQGSYELKDWIANFNFFPAIFPKRPYKEMEVDFKVHRGFLKAWKEVEDIILEKIDEHTFEPILHEGDKRSKLTKVYKYQHIVVVGYSHGGALAGLCHEDIWYWRPDLREGGLEGYGFEAPRFYAGYHVREELKERWETFTVIRTNTDIVTHCPPAFLGYNHVGNLLEVEGSTAFVKKCLPKCIKSHFPQVVYDALLKYEKK